MAIEKQVNIVVKESGLDDVNNKIDGLINSTENLSNSQSKNTASSKLNTKAISEIAPSTSSAVQGLLSMGKAMLAIVANPIGLILTAIVGTIALLVSAFRTFQPLIDKIEQGFAALSAVINVVKNTFIQVVTGAKSLGDAFGGLGSDISETTKRTIALTKAQQDLEDAMKSQEVATAKQRAEINKLNVMAKNRNLTEKERLDLLNKAEGIEKSLFDKRVKLADQEVRLAREAIAIKAGFNKKEIELLKQTGDATKELAEKKGGVYDEEYDRLNKARIARISLEDEATSNLEKNFNKQEALEQKQEDDRQRRIEDQQKANEKRIEANEKAEEKRIQKIKDDAQKAYDINQEAKQFLIDDQQAKDEALELQDEKDAQAGANKMARIKADYEAEKKLRDDKILLDSQVKDAKVDIANQTLSLISEISGKGSKIGKAIAIAQATASGVQGVQNAFTTASASPVAITFPAYPFIQAGLAGAFSAVQIAKIAKGDKPSGGGSSGGSSSSTPAPSFNLVQGTNTNQIANSISKQAPLKTYVVSRDMSTSQEADRNLVKSATL